MHTDPNVVAPLQGDAVLIDSKVASDQLNRVLTFFPRVDGKMALLFATNSTMIGVLAARVQLSDLSAWFIAAPTFVVIAIIGWSLVCLYWCAYPHMPADESSHVYFRAIACRSPEQYVEEFGALEEREWMKDLSGQIWANSKILAVKYRCVKHSLICTIAALAPWMVAISAASLVH